MKIDKYCHAKNHYLNQSNLELNFNDKKQVSFSIQTV
ncbi:hypothetical protein SAMN05421863_101628 [Nitrosomonas communis]|uniref:Uncharacterized protein n=1 Tax=Nitrosomonas communis TaxID=44574 RepID=A0A1I4NSD2_9PROT|nr:hypothetical protein SAMN05421863_101628 [Nitrosomonas communis]